MKRHLKNFVSPLLLVLLYLGCESSLSSKDLSFIKSYALNIPEPSGMALSYDGNFLWIVSDENKQLYKVTFEGIILNSFQINAEDLEGVCVINDSTLAVVDESDNSVIFLTNEGVETNRFSNIYPSEEPYGLEGITYNPANREFCMVNEMEPVSIIEFNYRFELITEKMISFAEDLSDITYDSSGNEYIVISDESKKIMMFNTDWNLTREYKVGVDQIEGVCFNPESKILFVVSDKMETLYLFQL